MTKARERNDQEKMHAFAGYIPKRGEFEYQWNNDGELAIADMEFNADDTREDVALKLKVLAIYNHTLDERERRKNFVLQQGLLQGTVRNLTRERHWKREEKDLHKKLDIFARFSPKEEHTRFIQELVSETQLRRKIKQLQNYRRLGIRTNAEIEQYESDVKIKQDEEKLRKNRFGKRSSSADEEQAEIDTKKRAMATTAQHYQGIELLSKHEQEICRILKLVPRQ